MSEFKKTNSFEKRKAESDKIMSKYPDRIPVIVERGNDQIEDIDKHKFLVPSDLTIGQFMMVIRKRMQLAPDQAIFLFINNTLPIAASLMSQVYREHKDIDGFLYVTYSGESTFGSL